ncbi:methyltransferase family protein [Trueperella sp. LYQ143]|uniref:methyltransferase family protein n=1 Tax=unclassified Trueperella TaxID=2630174 RepID=UPI00398344A5
MDIFNIDAKDMNLFATSQEAYIACCVVALLWISELAIWFYTSFAQRKHSRDLTLWLIIGAWCWGVASGIVFRDTDMPSWVQNLLFPHIIYYLGLVLIVVGVVIRCLAVITLRHAFTHNVQTTSDQHLIQSGLYQWVRNPAYTGSIVSLIGATFVYRSVIATISTILVCAICYGLRIHVEERALQNQFHAEFMDYCQKVKYRLFPGVY